VQGGNFRAKKYNQNDLYMTGHQERSDGHVERFGKGIRRAWRKEVRERRKERKNKGNKKRKKEGLVRTKGSHLRVDAGKR